MKYWILSATLLFTLAPLSESAAQGLHDFARFSKEIGKELVVVDQQGLVRQGVLEAATDDNVRLRIGTATHTVARQEIARADRSKDGSEDGAAKGLLLGLVMGVLASQASTEESMMRDYIIGVATFTAIGYAVDAANDHRQPMYRAPSPAPAVKLSFRFWRAR